MSEKLYTLTEDGVRSMLEKYLQWFQASPANDPRTFGSFVRDNLSTLPTTQAPVVPSVDDRQLLEDIINLSQLVLNAPRVRLPEDICDRIRARPTNLERAHLLTHQQPVSGVPSNVATAIKALKDRHYQEIDTGNEFSIIDHINNFKAHGGCVMCHKIKDLEDNLTHRQAVSGVPSVSQIKDAYKDGWNDAIQNLHEDEAEDWAWDRVRQMLLTITHREPSQEVLELRAELAASDSLIHTLTRQSQSETGVPTVEELDEWIDQAEKVWMLSGANRLGPKSTFVAMSVRATLEKLTLTHREQSEGDDGESGLVDRINSEEAGAMIDGINAKIDALLAKRATPPPSNSKKVREAVEGRWISVSERLPEKDGEVLVTGHEFGLPDQKRFQIVAFYRGDTKVFMQWIVYGEEHHWNGETYVTHWQPLPLPPKALAALGEGE